MFLDGKSLLVFFAFINLSGSVGDEIRSNGFHGKKKKSQSSRGHDHNTWFMRFASKNLFEFSPNDSFIPQIYPTSKVTNSRGESSIHVINERDLTTVQFSTTEQITDELPLQEISSQKTSHPEITTLQSLLTESLRPTAQLTSSVATENFSSEVPTKNEDDIANRIATTQRYNGSSLPSSTAHDDNGTVWGNNQTYPTLNPKDIRKKGWQRADDGPYVERYPYLLQRSFTAQFFLVTFPFLFFWCLLTLGCVWLCRPNSPLYREILSSFHNEHPKRKTEYLPSSATGEGTSTAIS